MIDKNNVRNYGIDLLKSIAIIYIAGFWHLFNYTDFFPNYYNFWTRSLTIVLLSAFVLIGGYFSGLSLKGHFNSGNLVIFFKKKLLRIYPLFLITILLFWALNISNKLALIKSIFFISLLYEPAPTTLWFAVMYMNFLLIAPLLKSLSNYPKKYFLVCLLVFTSLSFYEVITGFIDIRLIIYFPVFAVGVYISRSNKLSGSSANLIISVLVPVFLLSLALSRLLVSSYISGGLLLDLIVTISLKLSGALLLFYVFSKFLDKIVRESPYFLNIVKFFSYCSFSIYLFHRPVFVILKRIYFPERGFVQLIYLIALGLPLVILISWMIQKAYDRVLSLSSHIVSSKQAN